MLIKCPECELQVSDKAFECPHCGYPLTKDTVTRRKKNNKRRRLPNGFGQIDLIKNRNLQAPYRASITVGKNENGRPIVKLLKPKAYFETYNDAYAALVEYNKNPYDLSDNITLKDLYEKWSAEYYPKFKDASTARSYSSAWNYCTPIAYMEVQTIRARHLKGCIEDAYKMKGGKKIDASPSVKGRIKSLFNLMFDYAYENDVIEKNYARAFSMTSELNDEISEKKTSHIDFTDDEMDKLWASKDTTPFVDLVLYQCYSGWRPQELGEIKLSNVDLDRGIIIGGLKTTAGKERPVPIHPKIRNIVQHYFERATELNSDYLFNCEESIMRHNNAKLTYAKYKYRFYKVVDALQLNPNHRPHDPRVQFITQAKKYNLDEYAIKYIVGHKIDDITEAVYTRRKDSWLIEEMEKIL